MMRPKGSAAMTKPKSFADVKVKVEAAPRKRSRAETTTTPKNHDSASEADPIMAAVKRMLNASDKVGELEKKMSGMKAEMNALIAKQRTSNDELQRLRTELAKEKARNKKLKDGEKCDNSSIGVKKIGELDVNVFKRACEKRFPVGEAEIRAVELRSTWEQKIGSLWHSFRTVNNKNVVDERNASLVRLKNEWGDEAYNAVVTALMDRYGYSSCESVKEYEVWNFKENRRAKLEEVISWLRSGNKDLLKSRYVVVSIK